MHTKKSTDGKAIFAWAMYDFANSAFTTLVITFIYSAFFVSQIAENGIVGTSLWSNGISISALLIALLSPIFGAIADSGGYRKKMLLFWTYLSIIATFMLYTVLPGEPMKAILWLIIANVAFEMGIVFNNAFLPDVAPPEKVGRISGYGWAVGYLGGLLALFIALGFVLPADNPFWGVTQEMGKNIRVTNILVAVWFLVFSLPVIFWLEESKKKKTEKSQALIKQSIKQIRETFREVRKYRQIVRLLVARLFYNDGLLTVFTFGGVYAKETFGFTFDEIIAFGIVLNVMAGLGAFIFGYIDDKVGAKNTIQVSNVVLSIAIIVAVFAPTKFWFWIAGILVGIFSGPNQSASRSLMARFVPLKKDSEFFGFYAFSGKATAFLGPLLLGKLTLIFASQRAGIAVLLLFFIVGGYLLMKVDVEEGIKIAKMN
ncbi:MFS transporter [candidate division KSB1 bacterium]|nr:MFS transporter [candidate division KSB1 bacterium]